MSRVYSIILSLAAFVVAIDQATKQLALETFSREGESRELLSWFSFTLVYNYGAAFGILKNLPESIRTGFFVLLPILVLGVLWWSYVRKFKAQEIMGPVAMGLVVGGAIGNLIDRIRYGYVVDFIDWYYKTSSDKCIPAFYPFAPGTCHWPVFNVADSAITLAIGLLILSTFREGKSNASHSH